MPKGPCKKYDHSELLTFGYPCEVCGYNRRPVNEEEYNKMITYLEKMGGKLPEEMKKNLRTIYEEQRENLNENNQQ